MHLKMIRSPQQILNCIRQISMTLTAGVPALQSMNLFDFNDPTKIEDFPSNKHIGQQCEQLVMLLQHNRSVFRPAANHSSGCGEEMTSGLGPVGLGMKDLLLGQEVSQ